MDWQFTWQPEKAADNLRHHGVPFEEAIETFNDPLGIEIFDADHSSMQEQRFIRIGRSAKRLLFTVFTIDETSHVIKLISSREVESWERKAYEEEGQ